MNELAAQKELLKKAEEKVTTLNKENGELERDLTQKKNSLSQLELELNLSKAAGKEAR